MVGILLVVAIVLFVLAAFSLPRESRVSLGWLGLGFFAASFLWPVANTALSR